MRSADRPPPLQGYPAPLHKKREKGWRSALLLLVVALFALVPLVAALVALARWLYRLDGE